MGSAKDEWQRMSEGVPFGDSDMFACDDCLGEDDDLCEFIRDNATSNSCSYCEREASKPIAVGMDALVDRMNQSVSEVYTDAADVLGYDGREGGYQGTTYDGWDLMDEIGFEAANEDLYNDLKNAFNNRVWCERNAYVLNEVEKKTSAWEKFKRTIKYRRRYTFWSIKSDDVEEFHPDYLPVGDLLAVIGNTIENASDQLAMTYPVGTRFWRARIQEPGPYFTQDHELSPPPQIRAIEANRMSPPGIVMFYGAEDFNTACLELGSKENRTGLITAAAFESLKPLLVLNLFDMPKRPGFFHIAGQGKRDNITFLRNFASDIAGPIRPDKHQHIEYIPTQAFTEFIRYEQKMNGQRIDGIRYRSSKNNQPCVVLFCRQDHCIADPKRKIKEAWFKMDPATLRTVKRTEIPGMPL